MESKKRCRCSNFTAAEVETLLLIVEDHKDIVECKKTDHLSNGVKEKEWKKMAVKFNAMCGSDRTSKMLKSKWESLKKVSKKEYARYKSSLCSTGGGPEPQDLTVTCNKVLNLVGMDVTSTSNEYDSDYIEDTEICEEKKAEIIIPIPISTCSETPVNRETLEIIAESKTNEIRKEMENIVETEIEILEDWNGWSPAKLKKPLCNLLKSTESTATGDMLNRRLKRKSSAIASPKPEQFEETTIYGEIEEKKKELIELQIDLIKKEAAENERRAEQKHKLQIEILQVELEIKRKQLMKL